MTEKLTDTTVKTEPSTPSTTEAATKGTTDATTAATSDATTDVISSTKATTPKTTTPLSTLSPTTPSSSPTTHSATDATTLKPLVCQNGGTFNGYNCSCLIGFLGPLCEFVIHVEPDTINRKVSVNLEVNEDYNDKYQDQTSQEYKEFVHNFTNQMGDYYRPRVENYKGVVIRSISPGSFLTRSSTNSVKHLYNSSDSGHIQARFSPFKMAEIKLRTEDTTVRSRRVGVNVEHDVILEIPNKPGHQEEYANDTEAVQKAAEDLIVCSKDCPSFNVTVEPTVTPTEPDHELVCAQTVEDTAIIQYYDPLDINGKLTCVTPCHPKHSTPKTCHNKGLCMVFKGTGPLCYCLNSSSTWYLGDDCSMPIQKTALFAGLSVTFAILLLLMGVLSAFALRNKYREKRSRELNEEMVNRWLDTDFEWSRSDRHRAEVHRNPYAQEEATVYREEPDDNRQPSPAYQPTRPSPQNNFRQSTRTSSPSQSAHGLVTPPNITGYSTNQQMRINRPQIRPSLDD